MRRLLNCSSGNFTPAGEIVQSDFVLEDVLLKSLRRPGQDGLGKMLVNRLGIDADFMLCIIPHAQFQEMHRVVGIDLGNPGIVQVESR